jgi:hypothetical protein
MKANMDFEVIIGKALREGYTAGMNAIPNTMLVSDPSTGKVWSVADGMCGFAWINVKPATSSFARYLKSRNIARKDSYYGGVSIWVHDFGQSHARKVAYANAFARVLNEHGFNAIPMNRLD